MKDLPTSPEPIADWIKVGYIPDYMIPEGALSVETFEDARAHSFVGLNYAYIFVGEDIASELFKKYKAA